MPSATVPTTHHALYPTPGLLKRKGHHRISVCLPAHNEAGTIGAVVSAVRTALVRGVPLVDEILVVDDGSTDGTMGVARAAGARVVAAADVLSEMGGGSGKGQALWKAVAEAEGDLVVFCDADVGNFGPHFVTGLLGPLLHHEEVGLVKACYERPLHGTPGQGGRVTELVARPLIAALHPHLGSIAQPLAGETAGRREILEQVPFHHGYAVELGLLVDVAARFGTGALAQVDLGRRVHRNRPLEDLAAQALAVLQVGLDRAGAPGGDRAAVLARKGRPPITVTPGQRPPLVEVPGYHERRRKLA